MKRKLRGIKRQTFQLDFNLYRREVPILGLSDTMLSVIDIRPEGVEQTIVFIHGYAGCAETWEMQIEHFRQNYRVVVPDLRGHGQSDAPFSRYTMPELVADIDSMVTTLDLPEKFILVGHSFGGSICLEYAATRPERIEKMILVSTAGEYPLPRATALLSHIPTAAFRPWWKYRPRWNAEIHVMKRMMLNNMRKWSGWSIMETISVPTLIITGERDRYFPRRVFEGLTQAIPGAKVIDIGASKHKVQLERHKAVNRAIGRFIHPEANGRQPQWRQTTASGSIIDKPWLRSYSPQTPETLPIPRQPLHKFLESSASWLPRKTATIFYGSKLSYRQLDRRANQFAHSLHGLGVGPGDRVMIVLPNMPQLIIAYYGVLKAGGVVVLSNPDADAAQILAQLKASGSKVLVTLKEFTGLAEAVHQHLSIPVLLADLRSAVNPWVYRQLIARWQDQSEGAFDEPKRVEGARLMDRMMMDASRESPHIDVDPSSLAAILYTSGTTDEPKGVCLTHENLVANTLQTRHWIPDMQMGQETFMAVIPLIHSYGMTTSMNIPIALAATIILLPVFELQQVLEHIQQYKPSIFPGVPSIYTAINQAPNVRSYGLSSIKACISGAAPLPIEVQEKFEKLTKGRLVEGYGLTEASPVTHANPFSPTEKVGSIGVPIPNTDARVVDLISGEDLPPGNVGELLIRGPQVMQGYWDESEQDSDSDSSVRDGWLYTGDVAVMDADGFFQIISRKRDTIMAGQYSVYPRDVEEVLYENSKVMEAAVVGVQSKDGGQQIKAFIVPQPGTSLSKEELLDLCRQRLEPYAVPWDIEFREELPKSFVGKVLRRMLVEDSDQPES
jgi:long-chain acyl-CoA synthetase